MRQAPCVSPPTTTMLMSPGSYMATSASGATLSFDANGSTPATARGWVSVDPLIVPVFARRHHRVLGAPVASFSLLSKPRSANNRATIGSMTIRGA